MAIPSVFQSHVFGLSAEVRDNVHFLDEQTIIYPAGTQLVIFNSEQKTQRFLNVSDGDGITALAVNAAGTMAAVAVKAGSHLPGTSDGLRRGSHLWSGSVVPSSTPPAGEASLLLYDLQTGRKKKTLTPGSSDAKEFFSVSFSPDAKYVLAQSAGPDWTLYIWDWDKSKLRGTAKTTNIGNVELNDMTVNLLEASSIHVCISGNTLLRTYRHTEGNWKLLHQLKSDKNLLCNTFLSETTILCGTEDGKLLIFDSGEQVGEIQYALINTDDDIFIQPAITSIKSMPTSLLVGNSTGTCMLFEKSEDGSWKKTKEFSTEEAAVGSISVSPAEESAVISLMNSQLYHLPLDAEGPRNAKIQCNPMIQPFHNGAISGMDVASRKPLLATCGVDKSVRVWNFSENTCEVRKVFEEEPLSVAVHPTGLYILVGFSESIKLMNVLVDDVRPFWEVSVRGCRECRFSNGGQYFAVVHGLTIIVYHMWTLQVACHLKAHKAKVRSLNWSADDSHLLSCGMDGAMYDWDLRSTKRETEILATGVLFTQAVHTSDMKLIYVVGSDGVMKEISDGHVTREVHTKGPLTHLVMSRNGRMCFAATNKSVRALRFPLQQDVPYEFTEYFSHSRGITRLRIAYDDQYLFSAGEDGCIIVYKVQEKDQRAVKRDKDLLFSDEVLVARTDLNNQFRLQHELRRKVEEVKAANERALALKDQAYESKLKEVEEKLATEAAGLKEAVSSLEAERASNSGRFEQMITELRRSNDSESRDIEAGFTAKFEDVIEKLAALQSRSEAMKTQWENDMRSAQASHQDKVDEVTNFYQKKLEGLSDLMNKLKKESADAVQSHAATISAISNDTDVEVLQISYNFESQLKQESAALAVIKAENSLMHAQYDQLAREVDEQKAEMAKRFAEERRLQSIIRGLEKDALGFRREIQERDDTIQDKAKRIYDLKKKNQELEKFKFVLDYKIVELKKQVEPRERDIISLSTQIKEMDDELHSYHEAHEALTMTIRDLSMKVRATENEAKVQRDERQEAQERVRTIQRETQALWDVRTKLHDLRVGLTKLNHIYSPYVDPSLSPLGPKVPSRVSIEVDKTGGAPLSQREHLQRTVATLERRLAKEDEKRYVDNMKRCHENTVLLAEINTLKKEIASNFANTQRAKEILAKGPPYRLTQSDEDLLGIPRQPKAKGRQRRHVTMPSLLRGEVPSLTGPHLI